MLAPRFALLLCLSAWFAPSAWAEEAFITQLRLPARDQQVDAFAWRDAEGVSVERASLTRLGIAAPEGARVRLSDVPGLAYVEQANDSAIVITCSAACFSSQRVTLRANDAAQVDTPWGGYVNYDAAADWRERGELALGAILEANVFGPAGRGEASWIAHSETGFTRLETRWTIDLPEHRLRVRLGDADLPSFGGGVLRFGGVQIGRHFPLTPRAITHPTPRLSGEAETASTVELYIDGALRARERVQAGPFELEDAPFVSGAGEAQLVVTDVLGRQQIITRPFFVSTSMLRPGLSDWMFAAGAERRRFGRENAAYGDSFAAARYRRGLTDFLTAEIGGEWTDDRFNAQIGAAISDPFFGQISASYASSAQGDALLVGWMREARAWSFGVQAETRDEAFESLGQTRGAFTSAAASLYLRMGENGDLAFTAAGAAFASGPEARTYSIAYTPDIPAAAMTFRLAHTERVRSELVFGVGLSMALRGDVTASLSAQQERGGGVYRAAMQKAAPSAGGFGWRLRATGGDYERAEADLAYRGAAADLRGRVAWSEFGMGARAETSGAVGWIDGFAFAGRSIHGAFALVDVGAPHIGVSRDRLRMGQSGADGRMLAADLRAYDVNVIAIDATDLPIDRAPRVLAQNVTPAEGAGVVVRFGEAAQILTETRARFADGALAPRGAILIRTRDGARFPVGSDGRVVLRGALEGDVLRLEADARCLAQAGASEARAGLVFNCERAA